MSDVLDAEVAVRSYLFMLEDPALLVDPARVAKLEAAVVAAKDPIAKLKAIAELDRAREPDRLAFEQGFIRHAKSWAVENNIPVSSFRQLGVSDETLSAAGLLPSARKGARGRTRRPSGTSTAVSKDGIKSHLPSLQETFTLADLASVAGGSPMTLRKAVEELLAEGRIEKLGLSPDHSGRGRAPILYGKRSAKKARSRG
ncbi:MAG: hypothetical protein JWM34_1080 [Ilumatobacteraceae bacterium]|nr:hypothetical protein [Ilumatobacteraceae bacterium]